MRSLYRSEQALMTPRGQKLPEFVDNRHIRLVRLSALRTGRLYSPAETAGTDFSSRVFRYRGHIAAGRIRSMENDPIGNRTANLPACSAVPQITAPLRFTNSYPYVNERPFRTVVWLSTKILLVFLKMYYMITKNRDACTLLHIVPKTRDVYLFFSTHQ
jgi:hypothetical protein